MQEFEDREFANVSKEDLKLADDKGSKKREKALKVGGWVGVALVAEALEREGEVLKLVAFCVKTVMAAPQGQQPRERDQNVQQAVSLRQRLPYLFS